MAFFFKKKRSMEQLVLILIEDLDRLAALQAAQAAGTEEAARPDEVARTAMSGRESPPPEAPPTVQVEGRLAQMKLILIGADGDSEKQPDIAQSQELASALLRPRTGPQQSCVLARLVLSLRSLPFESRKHLGLCFACLMRKDVSFWEDAHAAHLQRADAENGPEGEGQPGGGGAVRPAAAAPSSMAFPTLRRLLLSGMVAPSSPETMAHTGSSCDNGSQQPAADDTEEGEGSGSGGGPREEGVPGSTSQGASSSSSSVPVPVDVVGHLVRGCGEVAIALNCGAMLREVLRDVYLTRRVLAAPHAYVWPFFEKAPYTWCGGYLDALNFDVASDAFATLKDLLTRHKAEGIVHDFLDKHYERLFGGNGGTGTGTGMGTGTAEAAEAANAASASVAHPATPGESGGGGARPAAGDAEASTQGGNAVLAVSSVSEVGLYGGLLGQNRNFFTRRQSLKLLAELLLDRANFTVMMRFISSKHNLKQMMNLLIDTSKNIQFEAFHVFKVFVANPRKPPEIVEALVRNKARLVAYLGGFHADRADPQFVDEKALIMDTLEKL